MSGKYQNLKHEIVSVEEGYLAEFAIPWSKLKSSQESQVIRFNIELKNGEHSNESSIIWDSKGEVRYMFPSKSITTFFGR